MTQWLDTCIHKVELGSVPKYGNYVWFYFDISPEIIDKGTKLTLKWGNDVKAENEIIEKIVLAPDISQSVMTFSWVRADEDIDSSFASIEVIADSKADFYFLWYLLPIFTIFIVLTFRKITLGKQTGK